MEITYLTEDKSVEVKLVYIVRRNLKRYRGIGKCYPKHTQCLMFVNGLLRGYGEVVKHEYDEDDPSFAFKEATRRVMHKLTGKWLRTELWRLVLEKIE